jgi:branched-chain amino acid transport system substrate-binding protein
MVRSLRAHIAVSLPVLASAVVLAGCSSSLNSSGGGSSDVGAAVKVGLLVPTSGVYAPLGKDMRQGFQLYLDQHGGKLGGHKVDLQVVDEGGSPDTGVPAAQGLISKSVNAVVGVVNSATALGVKDSFNEAKIPLIDLTGKSASDYVWRTSFSNGEVAGALGPYAAQNCKSAYLIGADYAAGKEATAGFEATYTKAGGKIAGSVYPPFGTTTNYQPYLAKIKQSGAKCTYAFFSGSEAVAFTQQYAQFGLKNSVQLYGSGFLTEGGVLTSTGTAAVGVYTSLFYSNQLDTAVNQAFVKAYTAANKEAPSVFAVDAYDAAQVLDTAFAKGTTGPEVIAGLKSITTVNSPRGPWTFSPGHGPQQAYYLREVKDVNGSLVNAVIKELSTP